MVTPIFACLYSRPNRMPIHQQPGDDGPGVKAVFDLPYRADMTNLLHDAARALEIRSWRPGVDSWRCPLDAGGQIVTAQEVPRNE